MSEVTLPWKTPKAALTPALRVVGVGLHARLLFDQIPMLRRVTEALAWHMTDRLPFPAPAWMGPPPSLLQVCLRHAFERVDAAIVAGETDPDRLAVIYLRGLFYAAPEIVNVRITNSRGGVWAPLDAKPLSDWAGNRNGVFFEPLLDFDAQAGISRPEKIRAALLARVCPQDILVRLGPRIAEITAT